jgi:crotonobetainyl-CoA:carnitine CoA-transferase CaiB-like acyl-CoA transferase
VEEVVACEHLNAINFFVDIEIPDSGRVKGPSAPYRFSRTPWGIDKPAPLLGQHNEEIYCGRLGYENEDLVRLRGTGII